MVVPKKNQFHLRSLTVGQGGGGGGVGAGGGVCGNEDKNL